MRQKFTITESERNQIRGLYEQVSTHLNKVEQLLHNQELLFRQGQQHSLNLKVVIFHNIIQLVKLQEEVH